MTAHEYWEFEIDVTTFRGETLDQPTWSVPVLF